MAITIKKVSSKKELKTFIRFNYELYKENPYSVPDLYDDMLNTFSPKKNAAFEFCEAEYFLAYKDNIKELPESFERVPALFLYLFAISPALKNPCFPGIMKRKP